MRTTPILGRHCESRRKSGRGNLPNPPCHCEARLLSGRSNLRRAAHSCVVVTILLFAACKKDGNPVYDIIPEINLVSVEPTTIQQFQDSVVVTIEYKDGDGDLGFVHPDSMSLSVHDSRLTAPDWYFVPPLSPVDHQLSITGTLTFKLNGTYLLGSGGTEKIVYSIKIKDRAGNWSNEISTPEITITQ